MLQLAHWTPGHQLGEFCEAQLIGVAIFVELGAVEAYATILTRKKQVFQVVLRGFRDKLRGSEAQHLGYIPVYETLLGSAFVCFAKMQSLAIFGVGNEKLEPQTHKLHHR